MSNKLLPSKVVKVNCPTCGELQMKIYPWSSYQLTGIPSICKKCLNKQNEEIIKKQIKTKAK